MAQSTSIPLSDFDIIENEDRYYLSKAAAEKLVDALIEKMESNILDKDDINDDLKWRSIVTSIFNNSVNEKYADKAASVELLADLIDVSNFACINKVTGTTIEEAVENPNGDDFYVLRNPADNSITFWVYNAASEKWLTVNSEQQFDKNPGSDNSSNSNDFKLIDTSEDEDDIDNVVAHIQRKETDLTGSTNVQPDDLITAQALIYILTKLSFGGIRTIPYSENRGCLVSEIVTKPSLETLYVYQQSEDPTDWIVYLVAKVNGKNTWIAISGTENKNNSIIDVNLNTYWNKDELQFLDKNDIIDIVNEAALRAVF